jgi:hypothetical protein
VVLLALLGLLMPRVIMVLLWLFSNYLSRAYEGWLLPLLGFFVVPTTTLTYAVARNSLSAEGSISTGGWLLVAVGALIDLGLIGNGRGLLHRRGRALRA